MNYRKFIPLYVLILIGGGVVTAYMRSHPQGEIQIAVGPRELDGVMSTLMTLRLHGKAKGVDDAALRADLEKRINGTNRQANARTMLEAALAYDLPGRGVRLESRDDVRALRRGDILHFHPATFRVFDRVEHGDVTVIDPVDGRLLMPEEKFWLEFSGVVLVFGSGR